MEPSTLLTFNTFMWCSTLGLSFTIYTCSNGWLQVLISVSLTEKQMPQLHSRQHRYLGGKISSSEALSTHFAVTVDLNIPLSQCRTGLGSSTWHLGTQGMAKISTCAAYRGRVSARGPHGLHGHGQLPPWLQQLGCLEFDGMILDQSG